jgi:hypothetical protein
VTNTVSPDEQNPWTPLMIPDSSEFRLVTLVTAPFGISEGEKGMRGKGRGLFVAEVLGEDAAVLSVL